MSQQERTITSQHTSILDLSGFTKEENAKSYTSSSSLDSLIDKLRHRLPDVRNRSMKSLSEKIRNPALSRTTIDALSDKFDFPFTVLNWINDHYGDLENEDNIVSHSRFSLMRELTSSLCIAASTEEKIRKRFLEAGALRYFEDLLGFHSSSQEQRPSGDSYDPVSLLVKEVQKFIDILSLSSGNKISIPDDRSPQGSEHISADNSQSQKADSHRPANIVVEALPVYLTSSEEQRIFDSAVKIKFARNTSVISAAREFRLGVFSDLPVAVWKQRPAMFDSLISKISECNDPAELFWLWTDLLEIVKSLQGEVSDGLFSDNKSSIDSAQTKPTINVNLFSKYVLPIVKAALRDTGRQIAPCHIALQTAKVIFGRVDKLDSGLHEILMRIIATDILKSLFSADAYKTSQHLPLQWKDLNTTTVPAAAERSVREWTPRRKIAVELIELIVSKMEPICCHSGAGSATYDLISHLSDWLVDPVAHRILNSKLISLASKFSGNFLKTDFAKAQNIANSFGQEIAAEHIQDPNTHFTKLIAALRVPSNVISLNPEETVQRMLQLNIEAKLIAQASTLNETWFASVERVIRTKSFEEAEAKGMLIAISSVCQGEQRRRLIEAVKAGMRDSVVEKTKGTIARTSSILREWMTAFGDEPSGDSLKELCRFLFSTSDEKRRRASLLIWKSFLCDAENVKFIVDPLTEDPAPFEDFHSKFLQRKKRRIRATDMELCEAIQIACNSDIPISLKKTSADQAATILANHSDIKGRLLPTELFALISQTFISLNDPNHADFEDRLAEIITMCGFAEVQSDDFITALLQRIYDRPSSASMAVLASALFPVSFVSLGLHNTAITQISKELFILPELRSEGEEVAVPEVTSADVRLVEVLLTTSAESKSYFTEILTEEAFIASSKFSVNHKFIKGLLQVIQAPPPFWEASCNCHSAPTKKTCSACTGGGSDWCLEASARYTEALVTAQRIMRMVDQHEDGHELVTEICRSAIAALEKAFGAALERYTLRSSAVPLWCIASCLNFVSEVFKIVRPNDFESQSGTSTYLIDATNRTNPSVMNTTLMNATVQDGSTFNASSFFGEKALQKSQLNNSSMHHTSSFQVANDSFQIWAKVCQSLLPMAPKSTAIGTAAIRMLTISMTCLNEHNTKTCDVVLSKDLAKTIYDFFLVGESVSRSATVGAMMLLSCGQLGNALTVDDVVYSGMVHSGRNSSNGLLIAKGKNSKPFDFIQPGVLGKFLDETSAPEVRALAWQLLSRLIGFSTAVPASFAIRAFDAVSSEQHDVSVFAATEFLYRWIHDYRSVLKNRSVTETTGSATSLEEDQASISSALELVCKKIVAAVPTQTFWSGDRKLEDSLNGDITIVRAYRIKLIAAVALVKPAEVSRALVLSEKWPVVFSTGLTVKDRSLLANAVAELASSCLIADRHLISYLANSGMYDALQCAEINASIAFIAVLTAEYYHSGESQQLIGAWNWLSSQSLLQSVARSLSTWDNISISFAYKIVNAIALYGIKAGVRLGNEARSICEIIYGYLIPQLSEVESVIAMTALTRVAPEPSSDLLALNALAKTAIMTPRQESYDQLLPVTLFQSQIRLIGAWAGREANPKATEAFNDWFAEMWKKYEAHELQLDLLDSLAEVILQYPKNPSITPAISFVLSACTKKTCQAALMSKCLSTALLAKEQLINKAATGRIVQALFAANCKFNPKLASKDPAVFSRLIPILHFISGLVACKQTAAAFFKFAEELVEISYLYGPRFPTNMLLMAFASSCASEDNFGKRFIANSKMLTSFLDRNQDDPVAQICIALVNTIKKSKISE